MAQSLLVKEISRRQRVFLRKINDVHIFVRQAIPALEEVKTDYEGSGHKGYRRYYVPDLERKKFTRRNDEDLKAIYDRFITSELYENFVITAVSQFESFLFEVLKLIIKKYPQKLTLNIRGIETNKDFPLSYLLDANDLENVLEKVIDNRLNKISYAAPKVYLQYLRQIIGVDTSAQIFSEYIEIKAGRDLLVHNSGVVNEIYLEKAGNYKRGKLGERLIFDTDYFDSSLAVLKDLSRKIKSDVETNFAAKKADNSN